LILLISSAKNGSILIFDVTDEEITLHQSLEQKGDIRCLNLYSTGLISSVHHGKAERWNFCDKLKVFKPSKSSAFDFCCFDLDKSFSISDDGKYLFGMNDEHKTMILIESMGSEETESEMIELTGHHDIITALLFDSKNYKLYSAGKDKSIIKWNIECLEKTGNSIENSQKECRVENVHNADIFTLESANDFNLILSGGKDKQIKVMETISMNILSTIEIGHSVYGICMYKSIALYFGKNSRNIGKWDIGDYIKNGESSHKEDEFEVEEDEDDEVELEANEEVHDIDTDNLHELSESPKEKIQNNKKKVNVNIKSCIVRNEEQRSNRFFNKSVSLNQSKFANYESPKSKENLQALSIF
jgi:WD40 repeat protein